MKTFDEIALKYGTTKASSHHNYGKFYEPLFAPLRDEPIRLLEIGVQFGFSIRTWLDYFPRAHIFGVDVNHEFLFEDPRYTFVQADQGDAVRMTQIAQQHGHLDVVIDDGCHRAAHIKTSLECLWPVLKSRGIYVIEDCFASWYGGQYFGSTIDGPAFLKSFVDDVNLRGKDFPGMPTPPANPLNLSVMEMTLESVMYTKGLAILRKK